MPALPPFLETLPALARLAYPIIQRGVREGLSSAHLTDVLQAAGLGIRRSTLLDIMRLEKGIEKASDTLKNVRKDYLPDPRTIPEALHAIRRTFAFVVEVHGFVPSTGETLVQHVTISSSQMLRPGEIEELASEIAAEGQSEQAVEVTETTLVRGVRQPGAFG